MSEPHRPIRDSDTHSHPLTNEPTNELYFDAYPDENALRPERSNVKENDDWYSSVWRGIYDYDDSHFVTDTGIIHSGPRFTLSSRKLGHVHPTTDGKASDAMPVFSVRDGTPKVSYLKALIWPVAVYKGQSAAAGQWYLGIHEDTEIWEQEGYSDMRRVVRKRIETALSQFEKILVGRSLSFAEDDTVEHVKSVIAGELQFMATQIADILAKEEVPKVEKSLLDVDYEGAEEKTAPWITPNF